MQFRATGLLLLGAMALPTSGVAQTAPAPSAITRTVVGPSSTIGLAMADDGTLAGNFEGSAGLVMNLDGVITTLKTPRGATYGRAWQISGNGRYISGDAKVGNYRRAMLWTAQ